MCNESRAYTALVEPGAEARSLRATLFHEDGLRHVPDHRRY
jgi:hypothetical protein